MKFIADSMLGRLARYLRASGYDVTYFRHIDDHRIIEIASSENRIILTRDTLMQESKSFKNTKPAIILVKSGDYRQQLKQLKNQIGLSLQARFSRCMQCNASLEKINKHDYAQKIPPHVYQTHNHFMKCPYCSKLYWHGSHCQTISRTLNAL